jgi:peptidoglycan/LPS O-acetylase OafA/YrhL
LTFLAKNLTLLKGTFTSLPGTFSDHLVRDTNGSLWTLPYEIKMYIALLALGWMGWLYKKGVVPIIVLFSFAIHAWCDASGLTETRLTEYSRFIYFFFVGSYFYLQRERIPLRGEIAGALLGIVVACMFLSEIRYRTLSLSIATPYLVMYCAYIPSGIIRAYNKVGDYSYGVYIYGAPAQQVVFAMGGSMMSFAENVAWSLSLAGGLAILSWHLLERRALRTALPRIDWRRTRSIYDENRIK